MNEKMTRSEDLTAFLNLMPVPWWINPEIFAPDAASGAFPAVERAAKSI